MRVLRWIWNDDLVDTPLKRFRRSKGMTQRQLAQAIGIHWNLLARYDRGDKVPAHRDVIQRIMDYTKLSAEALIFPEAYLQTHHDCYPEFADPFPKRIGRPRKSP